MIGVPTAQVPPSVKVPVPVAPLSVMAVGMNGPASRLEPAGQGAARQRFRVLVRVRVPVFAVAVAGNVVNAGVRGETAITAIVSWPLSGTV